MNLNPPRIYIQVRRWVERRLALCCVAIGSVLCGDWLCVVWQLALG